MFGRRTRQDRALEKFIVDAVTSEAASRPADDAFHQAFMAGLVPEPHLWFLSFYRRDMDATELQMLEHAAELATHHGYDATVCADHLRQIMLPVDQRQPISGEQIGLLVPLYEASLYGVLFCLSQSLQSAEPDIKAFCEQRSAEWEAQGHPNMLKGRLPDSVWWLAHVGHAFKIYLSDGSLRVGWDPGVGRWDLSQHGQTIAAWVMLTAMQIEDAARTMLRNTTASS